ncbi:MULTISPECIES: hypothetical protein [Methylobacterium]|uniref:hypothetical protein n=1 Tax=Methylobacterium TaxID=407 RepID=UPI000B2B8D2D|nr:hypothetical protein [Methylobacterium sp. Leaf104]MCI9878628.1 hypothetical protein [Methylobacterium goesingense]
MLPAAIPLAAAILAVAVAFVTGFDQRAALPPELEARFYGFFLDRYPLFAVAIVYGLACLGLRVVRPGPAGWPRRLVGGALALALFLAVCLHPTFGGVTLRLAFASGGTAFLTQQAMPAAYALGSALAATLFATSLGIGALLIGNRPPQRPRRWLRTIAGILLRYLTLWFALAVLGLAHAAGFGIWPRRSMTMTDAVLAVALACIAFLPHLSCNGLTMRQDRSRRLHAAA